MKVITHTSRYIFLMDLITCAWHNLTKSVSEKGPGLVSNLVWLTQNESISGLMVGICVRDYKIRPSSNEWHARSIALTPSQSSDQIYDIIGFYPTLQFYTKKGVMYASGQNGRPWLRYLSKWLTFNLNITYDNSNYIKIKINSILDNIVVYLTSSISWAFIVW